MEKLVERLRKLAAGDGAEDGMDWLDLTQAADALERVEREQDGAIEAWSASSEEWAAALQRAVAARNAAEAQVEALAKALEPFAKGWWEHQNPDASVYCTPEWSDFDKRALCTVGDIQRACAVLAALSAPPGEAA